MLIAFDGTGVYDKNQYNIDMSGSFCHQLVDGMAPDSLYIAGPGGFGGSYDLKAEEALRYIKSFFFDVLTDESDNTKVRSSQEHHAAGLYLAGYSRGGTYAIAFARELAHVGFPYLSDEKKGRKNGCITCVDKTAYGTTYSLQVKGMFLFDPVNRDPALFDRPIPSNVKNAYVLFRDDTIEEVDDGTIFGDKYARKWMGHANTTAEDSLRTTVVGKPTYGAPGTIKNASHGAAGGVPWRDRPPDGQAATAAANWMNQWLKASNVRVKLMNLYKFPPVSSRLYPAMGGPNRLTTGNDWRRIGAAYNPQYPGNDSVKVPFTFQQITDLSLTAVRTASILVDITIPADEITALVSISIREPDGQVSRTQAASGKIGARATAELKFYDSADPNNYFGKGWLPALFSTGLEGLVNTEGTVSEVSLKIN